MQSILKQCRVITVVGLSADSTKESFLVASYLKRCGYLQAIPPKLAETIDIVDVFRKSQDIPPVVAQAIELKRRYGHLSAVWMQRGIVNEAAAEEAMNAGLAVFMNNCLMLTHRHYKRSSTEP
jgi:uncharacterized protein